jgi:hypothetical protein
VLKNDLPVRLKLSADRQISVGISGTLFAEIGAQQAQITLAQVFGGPRGAQGLPGAPVGIEFCDEFVAGSNGAQSLTLSHSVSSGVYALYVNGLRQRTADYSVAGNQLSVPGPLAVMNGDSLEFQYYGA